MSKIHKDEHINENFGVAVNGKNLDKILKDLKHEKMLLKMTFFIDTF